MKDCCEKCFGGLYEESRNSICLIENCPCHAPHQNECCSRCDGKMGPGGGFNSACRDCPCHQNEAEIDKNYARGFADGAATMQAQIAEVVDSMKEGDDNDWDAALEVLKAKLINPK